MIPWLWDGALRTRMGRRTRPARSGTTIYPNNQSSRIMWYHDHAIGQTRLNAYAGVATGYIITGPR